MSRRGPLIAAGAALLAAVLVVVALLLPRASAVNKKEKELTQAHQQQCQRNILGEIGLRPNDAGHLNVTAIAEDNTGASQIHDAHA